MGILPFWYVLRRLCRSWVHLRFFLSFLFFSSPVVCSLSFGSPFVDPHRRLHSFSFISLSSCLARPFLRTLAYTHTRMRILLTTRFRWPRFVTMRFGSSVAPLHLILLHRQSHTLFVCLVLFLFICLVCVHMCLA